LNNLSLQKRLFLVELILGLIIITAPIYYVCLCQHFFIQLSDLPEYFVAAKMFLAGQGANIYDPSSISQFRQHFFPTHAEKGIGLISPPLSLILLVPVAFLPIDYLLLVWLSLSALAVVTATCLLVKCYQLSPRTVLRLAVSVALFGPLSEAMKICQVTPFLLLSWSLTIFALVQKKDILAGFFLSSFVLKPQYLLAFAFYLLASKNWKPLAWAIGFGLILLIISLITMGPVSYQNYFVFLSNASNYTSVMQTEITPTLRGQLFRMHTPERLITIVSATALLSTIVYAWLLGRRVSKFTNMKDQVSIALIGILPISMFTAPLCHLYDLSLLIPTLIALFLHSGRTYPIRSMVIAAPVVVLVFPITQILHYNNVLSDQVLNPFALAMGVFSVSCAIAAWKFSKGQNPV
jgi:hypothetical protein